ncbi:hypothetical protein OROGR_031036 [Orobanche gracilis]
MASSQTSTQAQKEMIIDGRIFARPVLIERTNNENEDVDLMEFVVSKVKQQGIYRLVSSHSEVFDKKIIEEFYLNAAVSLFSLNLGGGVREISSSVNGVEICLNQALLEKLYKLPSDGLKFEELEGYGTPEFLADYWSFFVGDKNNKSTHVSCHKKNFLIKFVFLHDLCCRILENRTGAFEMCTNLRFRMMTAIMAGERVNWCQIILKRIHEECAKPMSQKKSFGVIIHYILEKCGVIPSRSARKIGVGKFIGGSPSSIYNKDSPTANRVLPRMLPLSENSRDVSSKPATVEKSKKRKRSSHSKSTAELAVEKPMKKKLRKLVKSKPTVDQDTVTAQAAQPAQPNILQGPTPVEEAPLALITEGTGESAAPTEQTISSPVRDSTPIQDPHFDRVPTPVRSPAHERVPSPVRDPSPVNPTDDPVTVRSPSPTHIIQQTLFQVDVDQAMERVAQWKSNRVSPYDTLYNWSDWKEEELFVLEVTDTQQVESLISWDISFCKELVETHYQAKERARLKGKSVADNRSSSNHSDHRDDDDDDDALQIGMRVSQEEARENDLNRIQRSQGHGTSTQPPSPRPANPTADQEESVPPQPSEGSARATLQEEVSPHREQAAAESRQEDSVPPVLPTTESFHTAREDTIPTVSHQDAAGPSTSRIPLSSPISVSSPSDDGFLADVRPPSSPTNFVAIRQLGEHEEKLVSPEPAPYTGSGLPSIFLDDAVRALNRAAKELYDLQFIATDELTGVKRAIQEVEEIFTLMPPAFAQLLSELQKQQENLIQQEAAKTRISEAKTVAALQETKSRLNDHDAQFERVHRHINEVEERILKALEDIGSKVTSLDEAKKGEDAREKAKQWRVEKEAELDIIFEDSVHQALSNLAPKPYRGTGDTPVRNPTAPWYETLKKPREIFLPTHRQPSEIEVKEWRKTELMRYFWTLAQESPLIKKYKTLQEATAEFNRMLREGTLPKQVYIKSMLRSGNKPTHPDDWMLAFDRSAEGRALYRDREDDSFTNWWRGTKNDPSWKKH